MRNLLLAAGLLCATTAMADVVQIEPVRDNTLIQNPTGSVSNGSGPHLFVGTNSQGGARRALLAFDVAAAIPQGSTVSEVVLTLNMDQTNAPEFTVSLHRVSAAWGEGASSTPGGVGAPSEPGDATWIHTFFADGFWATPGGDFVASSASLVVGSPDSYSWGSTAAMVRDVQGWLDRPWTNHGWLLRGSEGAPQSAKRFDSRENNSADIRPQLTVVYEPPPVDGDDESSDDDCGDDADCGEPGDDDEDGDDDESRDGPGPGGSGSRGERDSRGSGRGGHGRMLEFSQPN